MESSLLEKYVQDEVLRIIAEDAVYNEFNNEILYVEKELKSEFNNSKQFKKYNELEELVIKSVTHILFSVCKELTQHPINTPLTFIKEPLQLQLDKLENSIPDRNL